MRLLNDFRFLIELHLHNKTEFINDVMCIIQLNGYIYRIVILILKCTETNSTTGELKYLEVTLL